MDRDAAEDFELQNDRRPTLDERGVTRSAELDKPVKERAGADWENARSQFPSVKAGESDWVALFDRRPEVMLAILGDIFRETKAAELRETGSAPTGRRPKHINGSMAELQAMVTPRYSMEPFAESVQELIGKRSVRAFAQKVGMSHWTLLRMMKGEVRIERWRLEEIARAGRVSPAYFLEWRVAMVQEAVEQVFLAKPNLSIRAVRQLQNGQQEGLR